MFDRIEFLLTEAFVALRRNSLMTLAAISTAAVALFLLGGLAYVYVRVSDYANASNGKFEMSVFTQLDATKDQVAQTMAQIKALPEVSAVKFVSKDDAWLKQQRDLHLNGEGLPNPLPDQLVVTIKDSRKADKIAAQIRTLPNIYKSQDGVAYSTDAALILNQLLVIVRWVGGVLGTLLLVTSGILIYNAIRLTVIARRREIRIMQLVGASYFTVRTPFVIEGVVQGAVGGFLATLLLDGAQATFQKFLSTVSVAIQFAAFPFWTILALMMAAGAGYGLLCSSAAVREPLRQGSGLHR